MQTNYVVRKCDADRRRRHIQFGLHARCAYSNISCVSLSHDLFLGGLTLFLSLGFYSHNDLGVRIVS